MLDGRGRNADGRAEIAHIGAAELLAHQKGSAGRREDLGCGHVDQGGLSGAVGADDDPALVQLHLPVQRADEACTAAPQLDVAEVNEEVRIRL